MVDLYGSTVCGSVVQLYLIKKHGNYLQFFTKVMLYCPTLSFITSPKPLSLTHPSRFQFTFISVLFAFSYQHERFLVMQLVVLTVYAFLYGRLYLSLSGMEKTIVNYAATRGNNVLQSAMASQSVVQLGLLTSLPMIMEIGLERGFRTALGDMIIMQLQLASVFFTFSLGTKVHYYGRTVLHGGAKYRATGRGFVVRHERFAENYRMYSRSHFVKGLELMVLLIVYQIYGSAATGSLSYLFVTFSMWFLVVSWLFAPFLFNPSGFEWQKIVEDWDDWSKWISSHGGMGVPATKSWESWWDEEQEHLQYTGFLGRFWEIVLALRFFLFQYGIVYHLNVARRDKSIMVNIITFLFNFRVCFFVYLRCNKFQILSSSPAIQNFLSACISFVLN